MNTCNNFRLLAGRTYFSRFFPTPDGMLVNHHSIARDGQVYFGTHPHSRVPPLMEPVAVVPQKKQALVRRRLGGTASGFVGRTIFPNVREKTASAKNGCGNY